MIRNNLAILLAERQLKITKVSNDTKISRTTLTSLVQNENKMIQNDTIDKLCRYLNITPCDFFDYEPFDISFFVTIDENLSTDPSDGEPLTWEVDAFMNVKTNSGKKEFEYKGYVTDYGSLGKDASFLEGFLEPLNEEEEKRIRQFFLNIGTGFITDLEQQLSNEFEKEVKEKGFNPGLKDFIKINLLFMQRE